MNTTDSQKQSQPKPQKSQPKPTPKPGYNYVGIDVSKNTMHVRTDKESLKLNQTKSGFAKLLQVLRKMDCPLVVFEATGGYERPLMAFLQQHEVPGALVNPRRIHAFALSQGNICKTDRIDAKQILEFAQEKALQPDPQRERARQDMADLLDRRSHLKEELIREKSRLDKASSGAVSSIKRMIKSLETEVARMDKQIRKIIATHPILQHQHKLLQTIKGVGEITAWNVLAYLSEITELSRNQIVAMAGLAPYNRDSGKTQGKRFIQGGRAKVRKALFMAARVAATHNPIIKAYVKGLKARGKHDKMAMVAAMRKLLIHMHSLLNKDKKNDLENQTNNDLSHTQTTTPSPSPADTTLPVATTQSAVAIAAT